MFPIQASSGVNVRCTYTVDLLPGISPSTDAGVAGAFALRQRLHVQTGLSLFITDTSFSDKLW